MSARPSESTRVQLCGRLSVEVDGVQLANRLRGRQVRLLLAYLLLNRSRPVGREELIGALWPGGAPRSQDAALRTLLSRLRTALGGAALAGREELHLQFPEPVWVDLEAAAAELARAVDALARGDNRAAWALAQVPLNIASRKLLPGTQADWLEPPRRELEDLRLQALEVIGGAGLRMGGAQLASGERAARALIGAEPYRESGYVLLMEALAARGNAAEGMLVFDRLRRLLRDELGTVPTAETIAAHERLLRPGPVDGAASENGQALPFELPSELQARADAPLVGRKREVEELAELWAARRDANARADPPSGSGRAARVVVVVGDPGIGKTSLAAELARIAHEDGAVVLAGRAPEEGLAPYQPFLEALRHYVATAPLEHVRGAVREYGPELSRLVPELRRRLPDLRLSTDGEAEGERYRLFEAVVGLLTAISTQAPILLVLDDLQWADQPTLLLLRHLARAGQPARMLILLAFRAETFDDGLGDLVAELRREQMLAQLDVGGLNQRETADLVRLRTGEAPSRPFVRSLHAETEGNPFFVEEIVRHLAHAGVHASAAGSAELTAFGLPEGVKRMISRRLTRLDDKTIEWLRVAAVIGREFDTQLLESLLDFDEEQFLGALEDALAAGVLLETAAQQPEGRYGFSHALIREALYEGMSRARRARIHRRVGEALEAAPHTSISALALHFTRAAGPQDADKAVAYAARAGAEATEMLAHEEAAAHYQRALEVLDRFAPDQSVRRLELLLALGEARVRTGERALAWETFRDAAVLADLLGDSASLARAAVGASRRYVQQPGVVEPELIAMLDRALERTSGERSVDRVRLLARLCGALSYSPQRARMNELSEEAMALAAQLGDAEALAYAHAARRRALWDASHLQQRLESSTEMLTLAQRLGNVELQLQGHAWLLVDLLEAGDRSAVDAQMSAFVAGADEVRQPLYWWNATVWRAMLALLAGDLATADELALEALSTGTPAEAVTAPQYYAMQVFTIRREQGRSAELLQPTRQLVASDPGRSAWRVALALLMLDVGRRDEAQAGLELLAQRDFAAIQHDGDWLAAITMLSEICVGVGDSERAAQLYEALLPHADANVVVGLAAVCLGSAARPLGKLALAIGERERAEEHFEQALAANERLRAPVWVIHGQLDHAEGLGTTLRGTELARQALARAQELKLPALAARARALCER